MHQSSHPTLLTSHIRVAKRKATKISTELKASIDVASKPPDLSALPIGGGVVGFSIVVNQIRAQKAAGSENYWRVVCSEEIWIHTVKEMAFKAQKTKYIEGRKKREWTYRFLSFHCIAPQHGWAVSSSCRAVATSYKKPPQWGCLLRLSLSTVFGLVHLHFAVICWQRRLKSQ